MYGHSEEGVLALRSTVTRQVEIPHEPGEWMELRQLGWQALEQAQNAQQRAWLANVKEIGADFFNEMQAAAAKAREGVVVADDAPADPMAAYDQGTVLRAGIVKWSYSEPVTPENIALLDPVTAAWAAREIVGRLETEEARKNGSGSSTSP